MFFLFGRIVWRLYLGKKTSIPVFQKNTKRNHEQKLTSNHDIIHPKMKEKPSNVSFVHVGVHLKNYGAQTYCFFFLGGTDSFPIGSMYGILIYIHHNKQLHVGKYTIHGWYGFGALKTYLFLVGLHEFGSILRKENNQNPGVYGNPKNNWAGQWSITPKKVRLLLGLKAHFVGSTSC